MRDGPAAARPTLISVPNPKRITLLRTHELTRRLVEERVRREDFALAGAAPLLRRFPTREAATATRPERSAGTWGIEERPADRAPAPRGGPPPPAPIDVEKLTEQVVRRIDEKIHAFRERMGRAF